MENEIYRKMYDRLFNRVSDAITLLEQEGEQRAKQILLRGQIEVEEIYLALGEKGD